MSSREGERERRIALALIVRRHLIAYKDAIRHAHMARFPAAHKKLAAKQVSDVPAEDEPAEKQGTRASTYLAQLIALPPYESRSKGKPEPAKHLIDFIQHAGPAHFEAIFDYFRDHVVTSDYRAEAPLYVQMAIHEVFDLQLDAHASAKTQLLSSTDPALAAALDQVRYSPHAIISAIEETDPKLLLRASMFKGVWNVIRFAHHGRRVVRLALEVTYNGIGRPIFKLYFRTRGMTLTKSTDKYVTQGSVIVLKGGEHVLFIGREESNNAHQMADVYPVFITCPTRISPDSPVIGLVQRRHDDGAVFATRAQFIPERTKPIDQLLAEGKVGSFEGPKEIAAMGADIPGLQGLLDQLERKPDDVRSGLLLSSG